MTNQDNFVYTHLTGPDSTAISLIGYNENTKKLFIRFVGGNDTVYHDVPFAEYEAFIDADSAGRYYNYNIIGEYTSSKSTSTRLRKSEAKKPAVQTVTNGPVQKIATATGPTVTTPSGSLTVPATSRFSVAWETEDGMTGGNPEFNAKDENDALVQFNDALTAAAKGGFAPGNKKVTIRSVTRYFD